MKPEHQHDLDQFKNLFQKDGLADFQDHLKIFEVFLQTEKHVTLIELHSLLDEIGNGFSTELIDDTMSILIRYGFAAESGFDNDTPRYEHRHPGQHHDHMICKECRKIIEFENDHLEQLQNMIARTYDFQMLSHRMEIYGVCSDCKNSDEVKFLASAKPGSMLVVTGLDGGRKAAMRLRSMGINVGDRVEIVNCFGGQIVIAVDYTRLVIGQGLAKKIRVRNV